MAPRAKAPTFTIAYLDGEESVERLLPFQQIAYEKDTGEPLFSDDESPRMEKVYTLAWYACGQPDTFDVWVQTLEAVSMLDDEDGDDSDNEGAPDPT